jgi:hypothetical protein
VFSIDPFTRKDWYDVKAPSIFKVRQVGKTLVNRTQGTSEFGFYNLIMNEWWGYFIVLEWVLTMGLIL